MTLVLPELVALGQDWLILAFAVVLRTGAMMALLPAFGERAVPARIRLVLALAFAAILLPAASLPLREALVSPGTAGFLLISETVAGLALGAVIRIFVLVLQIAGAMAAQATSLAQIFGGAGADPQPAIGHVLFMGGLALAVMLGLHVRVAEILILSYEIFPPGVMPGAALFTAWGTGQIARAFALAFTLAAPFVIASLIYNVALGVINRAMPQLMVAFVGAPAITAGGLMLLFLAAPALLSIWGEGFIALLDDPFGAP